MKSIKVLYNFFCYLTQISFTGKNNAFVNNEGNKYNHNIFESILDYKTSNTYMWQKDGVTDVIFNTQQTDPGILSLDLYNTR